MAIVYEDKSENSRCLQGRIGDFIYKNISTVLAGSRTASYLFRSPKSLFGYYNHTLPFDFVNHCCTSVFRIS